MGILERYAGQLDERWAEISQDTRDEASLAKSDQRGPRYRYRRASLIDPSIPMSDGAGGYGLFKPKNSPISNKMLKEMSLRDAIVVSIFQTRINQIARFSRPQEDRYEPGYKVVPRDPSMEITPGSEEEQEIQWIVDYIRNCGSNEDRDPNSKMDFDTFLRLLARDRLTFAAVAIETVRNNVGSIHSFYPAPAESIYHANAALPSEIIEQAASSSRQAATQFAGDPDSLEAMLEAMETRERMRGEDEPVKFVQVVNGKIEETFTAKEMLYKLGNPQNFIENNGYCIGELEQAALTISGHLQAENYNKLFFTHGFASRGLLHIKGEITPANLHAFRTQWYAQVSGNENSWRTPIIAGAEEVEWVQLSATNRDMEYSVYIDHIIRTLCALFQISPIEIGMDYLTKGPTQGGLGGEDNDVKLEQSQVRGLKPLLIWFETIINEDILTNVSEEFAAKYKFQFVGLETESKMEELTRQQIETTVRTSINDARKEAGMDPVLGGDIVQAQVYVETLFRSHKVGEIREYLFGYAGDSQNPELNYIDNPSYFTNLQLLAQMQQQQMMMESGGDPNADPSDPNAMDAGAEGENPFGGGGGGGFGADGGGDPNDPNAGGGAAEEGGGGEEPPVQKSMRKSMAIKGRVLKPAPMHPILQKVATARLAKAMRPTSHGAQVKKLDGDLQRMRKDYLRTWKAIQPQMMADINEALESEFNDDEDA